MARKPVAVLPPQLIDIHNHAWFDDDGSKVLAEMDRMNIRTMMLLGLPDEHTNAKVLGCVRRFPGRFVGGCFMDPRAGQAAIDELARWHGEGFRVVKLFPNYGYYPDDDALRPFFDKVAELKMAVLSHCGWLMPHPGRAYATYYAHPERFEKLIRIYTDTPFILAHMGGIPGVLETIMLTTRTPNTYADISPGQGIWALEFAGNMVASIPPGRLLWGIDSMDMQTVLDRQAKALSAIKPFRAHFAEIFYSNALGILQRLGLLGPE